jgi:hypothetical protein
MHAHTTQHAQLRIFDGQNTHKQKTQKNAKQKRKNQALEVNAEVTWGLLRPKTRTSTTKRQKQST